MAALARALLATTLWLGLPATSLAHEFSPGYLGVEEIADSRFRVQWKASLTGGLADALSPRFPEDCELTGPLSAYVMGDARVQQRDLACAEGLSGGRIAVDGLSGTLTDVLLRIDYLDGSAFTQVLTPAAPETLIPAEQTTRALMAAYLVLGIEHILSGVDHLLFVLALILLVPDVRRLVLTVTAFTVAHSITLGAATLDWVRLPQSPVEAVIALSILFLAAELGRECLRTARAPQMPRLTLELPWLVAFLFGLLHGFGFAGALAEIGLPQRAVPLALLFFNLGVETGQLVFIAGVLALAWLWRRFGGWTPRAWRLATAYGLGSVAAFWVIDRTVGAV
ncbi:MAG TPA: HupE/UreJ family protein [Gammaproteobacteria bacterium]|jgi:hydrogenase/urease accessory protein HupE